MDESYLPVVTGVAVIGDHLLRLLFSDGTVGDVDFSAEQWTRVLEPLNDPAYFSQVTVDTEAGTIAWPGGIDFAPEPLYQQAHAHPLVAVRCGQPEVIAESKGGSSVPRRRTGWSWCVFWRRSQPAARLWRRVDFPSQPAGVALNDTDRIV